MNAGVELDWLPPTEEWASRIKTIEAATEPHAGLWADLVGLAQTRLDFLKLGRLDRSLLSHYGAHAPAEALGRPIRLAILSSCTTNQLHAGLRLGALRRGLWMAVREGEYGQYRQDLLDPASWLHDYRPTDILLALDTRHLLAGADPALDEAQAERVLASVLDDLRGLWARARACCDGLIIQQTALPLFPRLLGLNEERLPGSPAAMVQALNERLRVAAREEGVVLLALDAMVEQTGVDAWHDTVLWHRAKQEISPRAAPLYGDLVARLLAAAQGRSAKCLVLDLDNTLWGGVIGDDGLEGIVLGQGSPEGEAFASFQHYAASLAKRGVILAVASKNDEANAFAAFDKHPEMVLRREDVSAFAINWTNKADNLRTIAQTLNIGLDSLVFADDNPFERNLIRRELPMVSVPELPEDPALYARTVANAGYFEALSLTEEDRARTALYRANSERQTLQAAVTDMASYLQSLEMRLIWRRFDATGLARVTQLINKSNQFNLTTIRYTEEEVAAVMDDPHAFGVQLRLVDRFGDNGIIAVVIGRLQDEGRVLIDTWLMSCRVLGRRVEEATLQIVAEQARALGGTTLVGEYRPTPKNGMVAEHYPRLGFSPSVGGEGEAGSRFDLDLKAYVATALPVTIEEAVR